MYFFQKFVRIAIGEQAKPRQIRLPAATPPTGSLPQRASAQPNLLERHRGLPHADLHAPAHPERAAEHGRRLLKRLQERDQRETQLPAGLSGDRHLALHLQR